MESLSLEKTFKKNFYFFFFHNFYFRKGDLSALKTFHIYTLEETALEIKFKILEMRVV